MVWLAAVAGGRHAQAAEGAGAPSPQALEAKKIFSQRCTACHSFGRGIKVGPDLKGVAQRRQRPWLLKFVRSSQTVIQARDATAVALFQQFNKQRMPDWTDLSEAQINSIIDWLAADGPDQKEADERHAELATAAEIERGRGLVHGKVALTHGGLACAGCHSVSPSSSAAGLAKAGDVTAGSLAPNLAVAYPRYQDRALTLFLKAPCSPRMPELATASYLTPEESFAIKAYLRQASGVAPQRATPQK